MRIAVIGAGLAGVCTALELTHAGHEVHVIERRRAVAAEASFAPGGISSAWLASRPGIAGLAPATPRTSHLGWRYRRWRSLRQPSATARQEALAQWGQLGHARLQGLLPSLAEPVEQQSGALLLLRGDKEVQLARAQLGPWPEPSAESGAMQHAPQTTQSQSPRWVGISETQPFEPGLQTDDGWRGALHLPDALSINLRQLAQQLKTQAQALGAEFHRGVEVLELRAGPSLLWRHTEDLVGGTERTDTVLSPLPTHWDAVVLCNGEGAPSLLARLGLDWPWAMAYGVSVTAPLHLDEAHAALGPRSAVIDLQRQVSISRLGHRVRVAGGLRLATSAPALDQRRMRPLYEALEHWFPGAVRTARAQQWQGCLPCLPDTLPVVGATQVPGIWVHLGQGLHGAAAALGGALHLAQSLGQAAPHPAPHPLDPARWS